MLISTETELRWTNRIKTHYVNKGYIFTKTNDFFIVKVEDLTNGSHGLVRVKCDCPNCKNPYLNPIIWKDYIRDVKEDGKYYCKKCALKLYGGENSRRTKLKDSISFAQWGIDNICSDFLEKYWDWEMNKNINPWEISYGYTKHKVWIKCQDTDYHGSYDLLCSGFVSGKRCSYCNGKKVHLLDSLGSIYPQVFQVWSEKNQKSPYEYSYGSGQKVWWKCPDGKHNDFPRNINGATRLDFRCPECQHSKGEKRIAKYLLENSFINISQDDYNRLSKNKKFNNTYFIQQKTFDGLLGVFNGNLLYDFYIPNYNLLIEYQGEFHDNNGGDGTKYMKQKFPKLQEHDKRKRDYAQTNNINLLEIWYWDFDNIETILTNHLIELKEAS